MWTKENYDIRGGEDVKGVPTRTKVGCWDDRESIKYVLSNLPSPQTLTVFTRYIPTLTIWGFYHARDSPVIHVPQHRDYSDFVQLVVETFPV